MSSLGHLYHTSNGGPQVSRVSTTWESLEEMCSPSTGPDTSGRGSAACGFSRPPGDFDSDKTTSVLSVLPALDDRNHLGAGALPGMFPSIYLM